MSEELEVRGPVVTFGFARNPRSDWETVVRGTAVKQRAIRLGAAISDDPEHGYTAFVILYNGTRAQGFGMTHSLVGTDVAYERKIGTRGLKTK